MHAALRIKSLDCFSYIATREFLHHFFKRRVFLPHNLIELRRLNSGFLQLPIPVGPLRPLHVGACHPPPTRGRFPLTNAGTRSSASCLRDLIRRERNTVSVRCEALRFASDAIVTCSIRFPLLRVSAPRVTLARSLRPCSHHARRLRGSQLTK